jgi:hypothetical protein
LRVPQEDGGILAVPPLSEVGDLLAIANERLRRDDVVIQGSSLLQLRQRARSEILAAARSYLADAGEPIPRLDSEFILMAGHQPELFHPGVWLKSFVLHRLAGSHRGIALNLLVDNDAVKSNSLHVPVVTLPLPPISEFQPRIAAVPMDHIRPGLPYEEWSVQDEEFFSSLPDRVGPAVPDTQKSPAQPDLQRFWEVVRLHARRTKNVPERLAAARRSVERSWGCHNLELPVSVLSRTEAFAWFAASILVGLQRFHEVFNSAVRGYRKVQDLRSRNHPFPDLARDGDWYEAPFWAWVSGSPRRNRLFVRQLASGLALRLGEETGPILSLADVAEEWRSLELEGIKVRPRALTNTLFARLLVADLFMHGIGGGRYDSVTDGVMRHFFGVEPPPYMVVSGTLRLPLPTYSTTADDVRRLERLNRDLQFNPQRHLVEDEQTRKLLAERQAWVTRQPGDLAEKRQRRRAIRQLNEQLGHFLVEKKRDVEEALRCCRAEIEANAILRRRDWAFCLFPETQLRDFCTQPLPDEPEA